MARPTFQQELGAAIRATAGAAPNREAPVHPLEDALAKLHYDHVLVDNPAVAARNLGQIHAAVTGWSTRPPRATEPDGANTSALANDLDTLGYRYLMREPASRNQSLVTIQQTVAEWSSEPPTQSLDDRWAAIARPDPLSQAPTIEAAVGLDL